MLIRDADIRGTGVADLRLKDARIAAIAPHLAPLAAEPVIDARHCAVLPGLHDHHIHFAAYAASLNSVLCGPPEIQTAEQLQALLHRKDQSGDGWLRGIGYHDSVAGLIDGHWLDEAAKRRPIRIQHRSGRLWIFNMRALELLRPVATDPLERENGQLTGRLYDGDAWLRGRLPSTFPDLTEASRRLAGFGITGVTDASATNGPAERHAFAKAQTAGQLLQAVSIMGTAEFEHGASRNGIAIGATKFHLHDASLPDFDETVCAIACAHDNGRGAAFHCVTRGELAFALAALAEAGANGADRIEHAAIAPDEALEAMRALGVTVVTQPHFIAERGDHYRFEVAADDQPWLYRARGFAMAQIPLAGGSDAPFGAADPWAIMDAAMRRLTRQGHQIGAEECLDADEALNLMLGSLEEPGGPPRRVHLGAPADLIVLDRPWALARNNLAAVQVRLTIKSGRLIYAAPTTASASP